MLITKQLLWFRNIKTTLTLLDILYLKKKKKKERKPKELPQPSVNKKPIVGLHCFSSKMRSNAKISTITMFNIQVKVPAGAKRKKRCKDQK